VVALVECGSQLAVTEAHRLLQFLDCCGDGGVLVGRRLRLVHLKERGAEIFGAGLCVNRQQILKASILALE